MVSLAIEQQNKYTTDLINWRNYKINMVMNDLLLTLLEYDDVKFKVFIIHSWTIENILCFYGLHCIYQEWNQPWDHQNSKHS